MSKEYDHHTPEPPAPTEEFWKACAKRELIVQKCGDCGRFTFIPQYFCRWCMSEKLTWVTSSGRGRIKSFTTVWRPQTPEFKVPYVVVLVELDEGYVMYSNLMSTSPEDAEIGRRVVLQWDDDPRFGPLPKFVLASDSGAVFD